MSLTSDETLVPADCVPRIAVPCGLQILGGQSAYAAGWRAGASTVSTWHSRISAITPGSSSASSTEHATCEPSRCSA